MRPSIDELQTFYASRHGQLARRLVNTQLRLLWPDVRGLCVIGLGYPAPFLTIFEEALRNVALMPAQQGAAAWPADGPNRVGLVGEDELPLPDGIADRVLLVHAVETAGDLRRLLREVWRIMADGARLVAIVPNRRGFWCWNDHTPFGYGQPYSARQLRVTLERHLFDPVSEGTALYLPPGVARRWPRLAVPAERLGLRTLPAFSGLLMVEAQKSVFAGRPLLVNERRSIRRYVPVPQAALIDTSPRGRVRPLAARIRHARRSRDGAMALGRNA